MRAGIVFSRKAPALARQGVALEELIPGTDLLILEQAIKNLETYPALVGQHLRGPGVAVWGHGR